MTSPSSCKCGALLMDDSPHGQCPACLLAHGLHEQPEGDVLDGDSTSFEPGMTLGSYRILSLLGRGGMASVYEALDLRLERRVALKVLPTQFLHQPSFARNFEQEAKLVARLEHPHIVPIYESGSDEGVPWMAMRLLAGGDMGSLLKSSPPDTVKAVAILSAIAQALDYAHAQGVVHRDIKPTNILFDREGRPSVADFGLARLLQGQSFVSRSRPIAGTPAYMAPEQALGTGVDGACDVYSLGIMAYQIFVGTVPFTGDTPVAVLMKHVNEPLPKPPAERLPRTVHSVIKKATAKDPKDRWPTAGAFVEALEDALRTTAADADETHNDSTGTLQRRKAVAAVALLVTAVLAWAIFTLTPRDGPESVGEQAPTGEVRESPAPEQDSQTSNRGTASDPPTTPRPKAQGGNTSDRSPSAKNEGSSKTGDKDISGRGSVPAETSLSNEDTSKSADNSDDVTASFKPNDVVAAAPSAEGLRLGVAEAPAAVRIEELRVIVRVMPSYPEIAQRLQLEGDVRLKVFVGPDGRVENVEVLRSVPLLDRAAIDAVRKYKYSPRRRNGVPERASIEIPVSFKLTDTLTKP